MRFQKQSSRLSSLRAELHFSAEPGIEPLTDWPIVRAAALAKGDQLQAVKVYRRCATELTRQQTALRDESQRLAMMRQSFDDDLASGEGVDAWEIQAVQRDLELARDVVAELTEKAAKLWTLAHAALRDLEREEKAKLHHAEREALERTEADVMGQIERLLDRVVAAKRRFGGAMAFSIGVTSALGTLPSMDEQPAAEQTAAEPVELPHATQQPASMGAA